MATGSVTEFEETSSGSGIWTGTTSISISIRGYETTGMTATVRETSATQIDNYDVTATSMYGSTEGTAEVTGVSVSGSSAAEVSFTNEYTPKTRTLTINKYITGEMGSYDDSFSFTMTVKDASGTPYSENITASGATITNNGNGQYSFNLSNSDTITVTIPQGYNVTVAETLANGYASYTRKYETGTDPAAGADNSVSDVQAHDNYIKNSTGSVEIETMDKNYTIDFKNYRPAVAPTGLESNHTTPYVLMITAAGMAGLALIGGIVARRIRRRRQE